MDALIGRLASYLLWIVAAGAAVFWLWRENRTGKVGLALSGAVGLGLTLLLILLLAHVHGDPRPFVQNPHLHPLIAHSADNGFPSDHSVAGGLIATLVAMRNRLWAPFWVLGRLWLPLLALLRMSTMYKTLWLDWQSVQSQHLPPLCWFGAWLPAADPLSPGVPESTEPGRGRLHTSD